MRQHDNSILYSPSDLVRYLGCAHATALDLARLREPDTAPQQAEDDAMGKLVQRAGLEHEDAYREQLADEGGLVEIPEKGSRGKPWSKAQRLSFKLPFCSLHGVASPIS